MMVRWTVMMVLVLVLVLVVDAARQERQASMCGPGEYCTPLTSCGALRVLLQRPTPAVLRRIRQAICNRDRKTLKVCCPRSITFPTPITPTPNTGAGDSLLPSKCRSRSKRQVQPFIIDLEPIDFEYVVEGETVELQEFQERFSWMAVLGYISTTNPFWACGGTLISRQYVLTAAHCVHHAHTRGATLTVVRLGELNLGTGPRDCEGFICAPTPQDFTPAEIVIHPDFDTRAKVSDDIALIRLDRKATLNAYVEPLCLPPAGAGVEVLLDGRQAEVSGWGLTENGRRADILQKASLPFVNKTACNPHFNNKLLPEQVCFGGGIQDSCRGDSGGPLVVRDSGPLLVGIVSRGLDSRCGVLGVPAVYTHVAAYRSWIIQNLRP